MSTRTVLTDDRIDPDRLMLADVDLSGETRKVSKFNVNEMAKFFFGKTNYWIRWLEGLPEHDKDGNPIEGTKGGPFWFTDPQTGERRKVGQTRDKRQARVYTLADIEEVAHALAQNGRISGTQLRNTLLLISTSAQMRDYL